MSFYYCQVAGQWFYNNTILSVVESMEECLNDVHTSIRSQILNVLPEGNPSRPAVENVFMNLKNPFSDLNTNSKWKQYFSAKRGVVQPLEVHLGVRDDSRRNQ